MNLPLHPSTRVLNRVCQFALLAILFPLFTLEQAPSATDDGRPTFTVAGISPEADLRIVAYGDMRFTDPSDVTDTSPRVRKWLAEKVGSEKPDLLFLSGDMPFHGSSVNDWNVYRQETASWRLNHVRVYPTLGNHEVVGGFEAGLKNYFNAFPEIEHYRYYSVLAGSVELIALDSLQKIDPGSPQLLWLDAQLAHLPAQVDFLFFLLHMPLMADVQSQVVANLPSPEMWQLRTYLEQKAAHSRVRFIAVNGHIHNYERFQHGGITYLVTGGGGARPYPVLSPGPQDLYQDTSFPNFHYILLTLHNRRIDATMYRVVDPSASVFSVEAKDHFALVAR